MQNRKNEYEELSKSGRSFYVEEKEADYKSITAAQVQEEAYRQLEPLMKANYKRADSPDPYAHTFHSSKTEERMFEDTCTCPYNVSMIEKPTILCAGRFCENVCHQCQVRPGTQHQTLVDVYCTALKGKGGRQDAHRAVVQFAELLFEDNGEAEVLKRLAVCDDHRCTLKANITDPEKQLKMDKFARSNVRTHAVKHVRHGQDERYLAILLLVRSIFDRLGDELSKKHAKMLLKFATLRASTVLEQEKSAVATALAIAENPLTFGYTFSNAQSFVNNMSRVATNYHFEIVHNHVLCSETKSWKPKLLKLLNAARPRTADIAYALMCMDNASYHGNKHVVDVTFQAKDVFTRVGFGKRVKLCIQQSNGYKLEHQYGSLSGNHPFSRLFAANRATRPSDDNSPLKSPHGRQVGTRTTSRPSDDKSPPTALPLLAPFRGNHPFSHLFAANRATRPSDDNSPLKSPLGRQVAPRTTSRPSERRREGGLHGELRATCTALRATCTALRACGSGEMWVGRDVGPRAGCRAGCGSGTLWVGHDVGRARCGSGEARTASGPLVERPPAVPPAPSVGQPPAATYV